MKVGLWDYTILHNNPSTFRKFNFALKFSDWSKFALSGHFIVISKVIVTIIVRVTRSSCRGMDCGWLLALIWRKSYYFFVKFIFITFFLARVCLGSCCWATFLLHLWVDCGLSHTFLDYQCFYLWLSPSSITMLETVMVDNSFLLHKLRVLSWLSRNTT